MLEDLDIGLNILIQRVFKTNFAASWDEQGDENQADETYALSTVKSLAGNLLTASLVISHSQLCDVSFEAIHYLIVYFVTVCF